MFLDRNRQLEILRALAESYPDADLSFIDAENPELDYAHLYYLEEHGLLSAGINRSLSGGYVFQGARITAKGLDFLEDDGGLTAVLGTVVVKLQSDTIVALLQKRIEDSDLPDGNKMWAKKSLEKVSDEALQSMARELVRRGIENIPNLYHWIRGFAGPLF